MADKLFQKILIPVDGSSYSLNAVRLAGRLASCHGSRIWILHVIDQEVEAQLCRYKGSQSVRDDMEQGALGLVADMKRELGSAGAGAETMVERGSPHEVILNTAEAIGADLVVMGKLGRRGVKRILLGSVAERVIEFSVCPILLADGS